MTLGRSARGTLCGVVLLFAGVLSFGRTADAQAAHGKEYWRGIAAKKYDVPEGEKAFALAKELSANLKLPDPELRDDLAYSILTAWILEKNAFTADELLALEAEWRGNLKQGIGESGTDSVFGRSFSALMLAMVVKRDVDAPFLGEERYRKLLDAALEYLSLEKDVRGFDEKKGWIHATAHTADLLSRLASNSHFQKENQARVLKAVSERLRTAGTIFSFGEQDRLAVTLVVLARRQDFDAAAFADWVAEMDKADFAIWDVSPPKLAGLQRFENDGYLLSAFLARLEQNELKGTQKEAKKVVVESLRKR